MREVFGDVTLRLIGDNLLAAEAPGLHVPAPLVLVSREAMAALLPHVDQVVQLNALLPELEGSLNSLSLEPVDIQLPVEPREPSRLWAVVVGNLGAAPEQLSSGTVRGSLYYTRPLKDSGKKGAILRLTADAPSTLCEVLAAMEEGTRLTAAGSLRSFDYTSSDGVARTMATLELRALQEIKSAFKPNQSLLSSRTPAPANGHSLQPTPTEAPF
jgi:hypothetical protein